MKKNIYNYNKQRAEILLEIKEEFILLTKDFEVTFNCTWASKLKQVFKDAVDYEKQMRPENYLGTNQRVHDFENRLTKLLKIDNSGKHKKLKAFINGLKKNRDSVLTSLYHLEVSPDNNRSERAIRNTKVKMKISNQFKSFDFANHYAVIRSVIDTTIKTRIMFLMPHYAWQIKN